MQVPNSSFEDWTLRYGKQIPTGYETFDEVIAHWNIPRPYCTSRSNDAHSGNSAFRIDVNTDSAYTYATLRTPFTGAERATLFRAWIKGVVYGDDTLTIYPVFSHWNAALNRREDVAATGILHEGPALQFIEYVSPFYNVSPAAPDTLSIYINFSSPWGLHTKTVGNWAILDDFSMDFPSATNVVKNNVIQAVFPNPAADYFTLVTASASSYNLLDAFGKQTQSGFLHEGINKINTETLPNGVYFIYLNDRNGVYLDTRKLVVSHN